MDKIVISLPDGSQLEYPRGVEVAQVARDISPRLYKDAVAAKVNGRLVDLATPLEEDSELEVLTFASEEGQRVFRHTSSHILAQAVKRLYPEAKFAIGPAIENGFYYDFDVPESFTPRIWRRSRQK